jgi:hypothetical protein
MQSGTSFAVMLCVALVFGSNRAYASSVLGGRKSSLRGEIDATAFRAEVQNAMAEALGCGGKVDEEQLSEIERVLLPMWKASPKNTNGRIERRQLRYLAYRYFMQRFSVMIRGFEPSRSLNASEWGAADILSQQVPEFVESTMESQRVAMHGFDLQDAVHLVATLEQLIWDSETTLLEQVFSRQMRPVHEQITRTGLSKILQEYMMKWILGDQITPAVTPGLLNNPKVLEGAFPKWPTIIAFLEGQVKALDFKRQRMPTRRGASGLSQRYSFHDAHEIVGGITQNFASFWESECTEMKDQLIAMDTHGTGRVPLSKFYGTGLDADWRFAESESYLRDLGALDETSMWQGKQVIIPNYIQAASNCIVSASHYLVCCVNTCEGLLGELEAGVGEPVGTTQEILQLVSNMTSQTALDDDEPPRLQGSLAAQLEQISAAHGGKVPLHGRLFAQWLHYAFPRECPFPHRAGAASARTPAQFGQGYLATRDEMTSHARAENASEAPSLLDKEELPWMSQWSEEEELIADYRLHLRAPWEGSRAAALLGAAMLVAAGVYGAMGVATTSKAGSVLPYHQKAHFV